MDFSTFLLAVLLLELTPGPNMAYLAMLATLRGRVVCNCLDVAELEIRQRLGAGATLEQLQTELKCGTSCGSCLPELRRMAQLARAAA